jgi:hypothetical protein
MESPNFSSESLAFRQAYLDRNKLDLDKLYEGYDATSDFLSVAFYKEMLAKYPDSKVILTERPVDSWFKSVKNTILKAVVAVHESKDECKDKHNPSNPYYEFNQLVATLLFDGLLRDQENLNDEELFKNMYLEHNAEVKRVVPAERLYVMQTGEGWEGICKFLEKDVPDVPYPNLNNTSNFEKVFEPVCHVISLKVSDPSDITS